MLQSPSSTPSHNFAVSFAFANGRPGAQADRRRAGVIGLASVYVVPALKYPANPPSVGEPETIKLRTEFYFLMVAISILSTLGALWARRALTPRYSAWNSSILSALGHLIAIAIAFLLLPPINEVPSTFPTVTLWDFRLASLGIHTVLWMSIGILFGYFGIPASATPAWSAAARGSPRPGSPAPTAATRPTPTGAST